jgi:hypothetical protein
MNWKRYGKNRLWSKIPSWHLLGGTEENCKKPVRIAGLQAEILTWDRLKTKQQC